MVGSVSEGGGGVEGSEGEERRGQGRKEERGGLRRERRGSGGREDWKRQKEKGRWKRRG